MAHLEEHQLPYVRIRGISERFSDPSTRHEMFTRHGSDKF